MSINKHFTTAAPTTTPALLVDPNPSRVAIIIQTSELAASDVQAALDELTARIVALEAP